MKESFVAIPNRMFAFETDYFATNDELLVFYHVCTLVSARNPSLCILNIELLNTIMKLDQKNQSRGKQRIKDALLGLAQNKYINIMYSEDIIKYNTLLQISIPSIDDSIYTDPVKSGGSTYTGFTAVTEELFSCAETVLELKVAIYVEWRSKIDYDVSYKEWTKVLGVCHQTAVKIISECKDKGLIIKLRGDYYYTSTGEIRQQTNKYKSVTKQPEFNQQKEINTVVKSMTAQSKSTETRSHKWFTDSRLDDNDLYIFFTTDCTVLKQHAEKRLKGICKTANGKEAIDKLIKKANEKTLKEKHEKQTRQVQEALSNSNMSQYISHEDEDYYSHYRRVKQMRGRKTNTHDFSYLLGND